jgi:starch phosphorylase
MWRGFYSAARSEDVPIGHVTNGVHLGTWMARPMRQLLHRFLGDDWESRQDDEQVWAKVQEIPDDELWRARCEARKALLDEVRLRSAADRLERGERIDYVEAAARNFAPSVLTVGFARRVATYKRLHLLTQAPERALRLLGSDHPIQVVVAGKAHPADADAKRSVQTIFTIRHAPNVGTHVAFIEDYDTHVASLMVAGCDVL